MNELSNNDTENVELPLEEIKKIEINIMNGSLKRFFFALFLFFNLYWTFFSKYATQELTEVLWGAFIGSYLFSLIPNKLLRNICMIGCLFNVFAGIIDLKINYSASNIINYFTLLPLTLGYLCIIYNLHKITKSILFWVSSMLLNWMNSIMFFIAIITFVVSIIQKLCGNSPIINEISILVFIPILNLFASTLLNYIIDKRQNELYC